MSSSVKQKTNSFSWLSNLWPFPSLPSPTGPYEVGTQDIEWISIQKDNIKENIVNPLKKSILIRLYYPAKTVKYSQKPHWLPSLIYGAGYGYFIGIPK